MMDSEKFEKRKKKIEEEVEWTVGFENFVKNGPLLFSDLDLVFSFFFLYRPKKEKKKMPNKP